MNRQEVFMWSLVAAFGLGTIGSFLNLILAWNSPVQNIGSHISLISSLLINLLIFAGSVVYAKNQIAMSMTEDHSKDFEEVAEDIQKEINGGE